MTDEQLNRDIEDMERKRANYMADTTPVAEDDLPKLLKIANLLQSEDTSLNVYELYKHPEARAKLFAQITEGFYMLLGQTPTQAQRLALCEHLEVKFNNILKKLIASTDKEALGELLDYLGDDLPEENQSQFIRDIAVSGLLSKQND